MKQKPLTPTQLLEALRWRYATKTFDASRKLPPEIWSALEDSLVLSASSFGLQPYRFLVVQDPAIRQQLLPHAWNQRQIVEASHLVVFAARTSVSEAEIDDFLQLTARTRGGSSWIVGSWPVPRSLASRISMRAKKPVVSMRSDGISRRMPSSSCQ